MHSWLRKIWTTLTWATEQLNRCSARAAAAIQGWGVSRLVRALEPVVILIAIIAFSIEIGDRQEERMARAWQLLTTKAPGNSGKIKALQYLNSESHWLFRNWWPFSKERILLQGIDLTPPASAKWKDKLEQQKTVLHKDCPQPTYLVSVQLPNVYLGKATLVCVDLRDADLFAADLFAADLRGADLQDANLQDANLQDADLRGADLRGADFRGADLFAADLRGTDLQDANLQDANLRGTDFRGVTGVTCRRLESAKCWEQAYRDEHLECGANRPDPQVPDPPVCRSTD